MYNVTLKLKLLIPQCNIVHNTMQYMVTTNTVAYQKIFYNEKNVLVRCPNIKLTQREVIRIFSSKSFEIIVKSKKFCVLTIYENDFMNHKS